MLVYNIWKIKTNLFLLPKLFYCRHIKNCSKSEWLYYQFGIIMLVHNIQKIKRSFYYRNCKDFLQLLLDTLLKKRILTQLMSRIRMILQHQPSFLSKLFLLSQRCYFRVRVPVYFGCACRFYPCIRYSFYLLTIKIKYVCIFSDYFLTNCNSPMCFDRIFVY